MPLTAITMGDACGIGPEIIVRCFEDHALMRACPSIVVGDEGVIRRTLEAAGSSLELVVIDSPERMREGAGLLNLLQAGPPLPELELGKVDARAGAAAYRAIIDAIDLAMQKRVAAICTAPIHKEALNAAGVPFPGHTEILAERSGTTDYAMMLVGNQLRTMLVTVHCSLRDAIEAIDEARELRIIRLAHRTLETMGIVAPRIAVAGLNPHAGEGGLFGHEDAGPIAAAVRAARDEGIDARGPEPGDTVFMRARRGEFDLVVAQYHDQGLIPIKLLGLDDGVNVTAGLPFVRTSPDHGTAYDIAGKGIADPASMKSALRLAASLGLEQRIGRAASTQGKVLSEGI